MTDLHGRKIEYLRVSVTDRCDLQCRYCKPEHGSCQSELLTEDELLAAIGAAAGLGIRKIRLTGGEPLVRNDILSICRKAAAIDGVEELSLTTNGVRLAELAAELRDAGVRRLNVSLDTLDREKYIALTGADKLANVLCGLETALGAGFDKIKINTVLMDGFNNDEIEALSRLTLRYPVDVRFIELMPMTTHNAGGYLPCSAVLEALPQLTQDGIDGVARQYRLPDAKGAVGLITPLSDHFCSRCDRLRLTADGKVKPCLHSGDEFSLKGLSKDEMAAVFVRAAEAKPLWHGTLDAQHPSRAGRSMNRIGG